MATQKTRTQRRMEKRQAIILLVLVLVVSLASFTLGVIIGRRGAERDLAQKVRQAERVLVTKAPAPVTPTVVPPPAKTVPDVAGETATDTTKLTFYDDLGKETVPLGSGINLPPEDKKTAEVAQPPIDLPDQPIVKKKIAEVVNPVATAPVATATVAEPQPSSALPEVSTHGHHAVQIGSFGVTGDAIALKKKMVKKGYPAYVVEADLGKKGLWYRVRIGPYADVAAARTVQKQLEEKEKVKGFIARQ